MLSVARACDHKFFRSHIEEWKPTGQNVHQHAGKAFASGLEAARVAFYVEGHAAPTAVAIGLGALITAYGPFICPPDSAKSLERTAGALEYYFSEWPLGSDEAKPTLLPNNKHGIEVNFVEPLPIAHPETKEPLLFCGRSDMLIDYAGGIFVEDDKTATQLGGSWARQWDLRAQFSSYCWGFQHICGQPIQGVLIRGVAILKTQYNRAEAITYRAPWQIEEWFEASCDLIETLIVKWKAGIWRKNLDEACNDWGGCSFRNACLAQDPSPWLNQYFEKRHWDPITRQETLL